MSDDDGLRISGGGSIRVETGGMLRAAGTLTDARDGLGVLITSTGGSIDACPPGTRRVRLEEARAHLSEAQVQSERAADGLRTAAWRYGAAERAAADAQRAVWAWFAAGTGTGVRVVAGLAGPIGGLAVGGAVVEGAALALTLRTLLRWATEGDGQPQLDPAALDALALAIGSLDDVIRGLLLIEQPQHLLFDDPAAPFGTEAIATSLARAGTRHPGDPLAITASPGARVVKPKDLAELADRLPRGEEPAGQVRVERYEDADGPRWIVYIAGTVTFAPDGGAQPFDLSSNLFGVGDVPTDAQRAVVQAMTEAGVGRDEPVLLVGHSQGALTAARVAEHGGYRVGGVLELGGPTGQIVLPEDVPRLAVEHDEDPVPALGGVPAAGAAGLRRVLVRRSIQHGGAQPGAVPLTGGFHSHDTPRYSETLRRAEASGDDRVAAYRQQVGGFLGEGSGTATRYRADRIDAVQADAVRLTPSPAPTAGAAPAR